MELEKKDIKIFLISGKARSGKNEVAKIIADLLTDKKCITISFGYYIKHYAKKISNWDGSEETKPRELLQNLGIELIKNKIDSNLVINRVIEDIEVYSYFYDVIIVSDVRLLDELYALKNKYKNITSIRIIREEENHLSEKEKNHITEIDLDNCHDFDYEIENDSNIKDKIEKIVRY